MGKLITRGLIPLIVIAGGLFIGAWFFTNPDEAGKRPKPEAQALLVETGHPDYGTYTAYVEAMGQVTPAAEISLKSQVSGEVIVTDSEFIPGGFFREGDAILDIDPADYELAVQKQEAVLQQAQADYELEMGRQSVAQDELKILERTTGRKPESPDLALRKPQLMQAQAELEKVKSDLDAVKLDLSRTTIKAPFNAIVTSRDVTLGDKVSSGESLATLVSTDEYWVEVSIPVHDLRWLDIPQAVGSHGSDAVIELDGGRGERSGSLIKLTGALDTGSRLATLLVSVPDPLAQNDTAKTPLIIGDYAKVTLHGKDLENVIRVPLSWVRDGDIVWLKKDGRLTYQPVQIIYEDRNYAYISDGLNKDDEIVISDIAVPVIDMKVRTADKKREMPEDKSDQKGMRE